VYSLLSIAIGLLMFFPDKPRTPVEWAFVALTVLGCSSAYGAVATLVFRPVHQSMLFLVSSNRALLRMVRRETLRVSRLIHERGQLGDEVRARSPSPPTGCSWLRRI
jgi:hypothetical protein